MVSSRRTLVLVAVVLLVSVGLVVVGVVTRGQETAVATASQRAGGDRAVTPRDGPSTALAESAVPAPPGGRQPTAAEPLRVVVTGDSVGQELGAAIVWALEAGGQADAEFVLSPTLGHDEASQLLWRARVAEQDPEVIVLAVGYWESFLAVSRAVEQGLTVPGPDWASWYDAEVLVPWVELLTGGGAEIVWVGMPDAVADRGLRFDVLNATYRSLAARRPEVTFVDGQGPLAGPDGGYAELGTDALGRPARWRSTDGLHLCPDGAVRLAEPVLDQISDRWNVRLGPGWRQGDWRAAERQRQPELCPQPIP